MTSETTWKAYYEKTLARPPRETLLLALSRFDDESVTLPRAAVDLGCGAGRDTVEMLRRGWHVLGVDKESDALERLIVTLPPCNLINASFSLQGCPKQAFPALWGKVRAALCAGGRFAGHLLGERDTWAEPSRNRNDMTFCTPAELEVLCGPFEVEWLQETEEDSVTPRGETKHWHFYQLVLRKPT
jgi:hypothetical protein